jgi:citrate synthase
VINKGLTTGETAQRLGVKPSTVYAYVSRGLLHPDRTTSGSTFDPREVAQLARSGRHPGRSARAAREAGSEPVFVTELTLIEDGRLYYRGLDAVELSRHCRFEEVAGWLWRGQWPAAGEPWSTPAAAASALTATFEAVGEGALPIERFMLVAMAVGLADDLRHDLNPGAVPITGSRLLSALADALPVVGGADGQPGRGAASSISERLWARLSPLPATPARVGVLDAALVLVADHELAPSTLAARVAAAFRADPYAVVSTGFGPASGSWHSGAPSEVEGLLAEAHAGDAERAIGARLRRTGSLVPGFGMRLYPRGDPRGAELLSRLGEIGGSAGRRAVVDRILAIGSGRGFPPPNVDLGLGALSFCAEMVPGAGQAIACFGRVAGWLAHAMEEYASPTQFRTRADYVGARPDPGPPG